MVVMYQVPALHMHVSCVLRTVCRGSHGSNVPCTSSPYACKLCTAYSV